MRESVKEKKVQKRYNEEVKRQAVELVIHNGKSQTQIARELGVAEYSLTGERLWSIQYAARNVWLAFANPRRAVLPPAVDVSLVRGGCSPRANLGREGRQPNWQESPPLALIL